MSSGWVMSFSCSGDYFDIMCVLKQLYDIGKFIIPIVLIVYLIIDFAKLVITSKDDEKKKRVKLIHTRLIAGVVYFLLPTFVFLIINLCVSTNKTELNAVRDCWYSAK